MKANMGPLCVLRSYMDEQHGSATFRLLWTRRLDITSVVGVH